MEYKSRMLEVKNDYQHALQNLEDTSDQEIMYSPDVSDRWATVGGAENRASLISLDQDIPDHNLPELKTLKDKITFILQYKGRALKRTELEEEMEILNNGNKINTRNALRKMQDRHYLYSVSINGSKKNQYWALPNWFVDTESGTKLASEYLPPINFDWNEKIKIKIKGKMASVNNNED